MKYTTEEQTAIAERVKKLHSELDQQDVHHGIGSIAIMEQLSIPNCEVTMNTSKGVNLIFTTYDIKNGVPLQASQML